MSYKSDKVRRQKHALMKQAQLEKNEVRWAALEWSQLGWLRLLEDVFDCPIRADLNSFSVEWTSLPGWLSELPVRLRLALWFRYESKLTFKDLAPKVGHSLTGEPVAMQHAVLLVSRGIGQLRRPIHLAKLQKLIVGYWPV